MQSILFKVRVGVTCGISEVHKTHTLFRILSFPYRRRGPAAAVHVAVTATTGKPIPFALPMHHRYIILSLS